MEVLEEYIPTIWVNSTSPAINEDNLNHIEQGIKNATNFIIENGLRISDDGDSITKEDGSWIKNQPTAWASFDGTTTPPTLKDSYNIASMTRLADGTYYVQFEEPMDNSNYAVVCNTGETKSFGTADVLSVDDFKFTNITHTGSTDDDRENHFIVIGGKY